MKVTLASEKPPSTHSYTSRLRIDAVHVVLELKARIDGVARFRIESTVEPYLPFLADADAFDLVSNEIPSCWCVVLPPQAHDLSLVPRSWHEAPFENGFWPEFFDGNYQAIGLYRAIRDEIYRDCGVEPPRRPDWKW